MYKKKAKDLRAVIAAKQQQQTPASPTVVHTAPKRERKVECTEEYLLELQRRHRAVKDENKTLSARVQLLESQGKDMRKELDDIQFHSRSGVRLLLEAVKKKKSPLEKQIIHHTEKVQMLKEEQDLAWTQIEGLLIVMKQLQSWQDDARYRGKSAPLL